MPTRLNLVVLRVADLDRAATFYGTLGLTFESHRHGTGPMHLANESAGFVFELYLATPEQSVSSSTRIGFVVSDVDAILAKIDSAAIVSPAKDSPWGRRAVVSDPDGHRVELIQQ